MNLEDYPSLIDNDGNVVIRLISLEGQGALKEIISFITLPIEPKINKKTMSEEQINIEKEKANKPLNINQLRKYFDAFNNIYLSKLSEREKKIQLLMLKANASYARQRLTIKHFYLFFEHWMNIIINSTDEKFVQNLNALKLHLEALVAYYPKQK